MIEQSNEFDFENRIVSNEYDSFQDAEVENDLRPKVLEDYIGQEKAKSNLKVYIESAKLRGEALDHVLLYGPPGLGKTTLSGIIANEMGVNIRTTSGPAIEKQGDLAAILTNLQEGDVLFIDEIHRLSRAVEEILYPAMEDYALDIIIGKGPSARSIRLPIPRFTLIGATTRAGQLTTPLRDRFGVLLKLELYTPDELATIVKRSASILEISITEDGAKGIASRSRGTPRIANRLLKVALQGKVIQVIEDGNHIELRVNINGEYSDTIYVMYIKKENEGRILEDDMIKFYGSFEGLLTYTSILGAEITIPQVDAQYIDLVP